MQREQQNIYKTARLGSGLTQEAAAEVLDLSVESVRAYETGQTVPPNDTVLRMAEAYGSPGLRLEHARATDELGIIPQGAVPQSFELLTIQIYTNLMTFAEKHRGQQLLQIAADGVIDEDERPLLDEIVAELEAITAPLLALKVCEGAKKERPEAGTSKRSRSAVKQTHKTLDKNIVPQIPRNASKICAGKAVIL